MCLALPMRVRSISGSVALCTVEGVDREVSLLLIDRVCVGDHLVVHAGFAISRLDPEEARITLDLHSAGLHRQDSPA